MELQKELQEKYEYKNGSFYFKNSGRNFKAGDKAGCLNKPLGRYLIKHKNKTCHLHRLIFAFHNGYLPAFIDHINGDPKDNRIENLREVTKSQNLYNCGKRKTFNPDRASKYKGVLRSNHNTFYAAIAYEGTKYYLGSFKTEEDAARAYNERAIEHHGEFARLNIIE